MAGYAQKKSTETLCSEIIRDVRAGQVAPVYCFMGDEGYYIDHMSEFLVNHFVPNEEDRDFSLITLYGSETDTGTIGSSAMGFPMMGDRIVVVVREAQALKDLARMEKYLDTLIASRQQAQKEKRAVGSWTPEGSWTGNIIILCHMHGTLDGRSKVTTKLGKAGVVMQSERLRDYQLGPFINGCVKRKRLAIDASAAQMLADHVGTDLSRMAGEIDKLAVALPEGQTLITPALVLEHIGVSKEYNVFELQDAICQKNVRKVNEIATYFEKNPKDNPPQKILPTLFKFFARLMQAYYSPDRSPDGIAQYVGANPWQVKKNILPAMQLYSGVKCMQILGEIRRADARSKGVGATANLSNGDLMKELYFFILH